MASLIAAAERHWGRFHAERGNEGVRFGGPWGASGCRSGLSVALGYDLAPELKRHLNLLVVEVLNCARLLFDGDDL